MGSVDARVVGVHGGRQPVGRDCWARRTRQVSGFERLATTMAIGHGASWVCSSEREHRVAGDVKL